MIKYARLKKDVKINFGDGIGTVVPIHTIVEINDWFTYERVTPSYDGIYGLRWSTLKPIALGYYLTYKESYATIPLSEANDLLEFLDEAPTE